MGHGDRKNGIPVRSEKVMDEDGFDLKDNVQRRHRFPRRTGLMTQLNDDFEPFSYDPIAHDL